MYAGVDRAVVDMDFREAIALGLEKVRASKLNLFSCMDANDLDWEFYPHKFKSKIHNPSNTQLAVSNNSAIRE